MTNKKRSKSSTPKEGDKLTAKQLQQSILQFFRANPERRFTPKQIIQHLSLKNNKDAVRHAIEQLQAGGQLKTVPALKLAERSDDAPQRGGFGESRQNYDDDHQRQPVRQPGKFSAAADEPGDYSNQGPSKSRGFTKSNGEQIRGRGDNGTAPSRSQPRGQTRSGGNEDEAIGKVDLSRSGSGYVVIEGREQDVFISARNLAGAMNGDTVRVRVWTSRGRNKAEGEVLEVVQHAVEYFLGTYRDSRKYGVVIPDRIEHDFDIAVMPDDAMGARDGEKVVVHVTDWPDRAGRNPRGVITEVLGATGSTDLEMKGILINQGFDLHHSPEAIAEANAIDETIDPQEVHRRLDLRDVLTFTIDPYDAKDFDDAISYRRLDNGRLEIGVHIADVSHYVKPGSALDNEAARSTTSVYLVDRVLPMLPEKLSNGVCSLRPNEDKCTFSAMFEFDDRLAIKRTYFAKTLTHSNHRFTYEEAQELIEGKEHKLGEVMRHCNEIADKLRAQRFRNGSIDFDSEEVRFRLDAEGNPLEAYVKPRQASNMLVEDFMLLANRSVAEFIAAQSKKLEIPFPYRVHDEPDPEKMANLATFAARFGIELDLSTPTSIAKSYNRLRQLARERPELAVLGPLAIRTMAKAEYTTTNIGHYGLGFEHYTHFTSPIRRYADVLVHRILERNLGKAEYRVDKDWLEEHCRHISERERAAVKAERESTSYFQVLYIKDHIGEEFEGAITGVIERGVFVQLTDNYCEGFVPFSQMEERYELGQDRLVATSRSGKKLQMGSKVRVQIVSADPDTRRIEMALVENLGVAEVMSTAPSEAGKPKKAKREASAKTGAGAKSASAKTKAPRAKAKAKAKPSSEAGAPKAPRKSRAKPKG